MDAPKEWTVTYTKHKTQKLKVFHDGSVVVKCFTPTQRKVLLVGDEGKILESRYLDAKEEVFSGCQLDLQGYFVEVGDPVDGNIPPLRISAPVSGSNQVAKPGRWVIRYTEMKGQKRKVYHDGFLQPFPNNDRNVTLLNDQSEILRVQVLGSDVVLAPGSRLTVGKFEVEIDEVEEAPGVKPVKAVVNSLGRISVMAVDKTPGVARAKTKKPDFLGIEALQNSNPAMKSAVSSKTINEILQKIKRPKINAIDEERHLVSQPKVFGKSCSRHPEDGYQQPVACSLVTSNTGEVARKGELVGHAEKQDNEDSTRLTSISDGHPLTKLESHATAETSSCKGLSRHIPGMLLAVRDIFMSEKSSQSPCTKGASDDKLIGEGGVDIMFQAGTTFSVPKTVDIPNSFSDFSSYKQIMCAAVVEEVNQRLQSFATIFQQAKKRALAICIPRPSCDHGVAHLELLQSDEIMKGRFVYVCPKRQAGCPFTAADEGVQIKDKPSEFVLKDALSWFGVNLHVRCELYIRKSFVTASNSSKGRTPNECRPMLKIGAVNGQTKPLRGDILIISNNSDFSLRTRDDFVTVSECGGMTPSGLIYLSLLGGSSIEEVQRKVYALHYQGLSSELRSLKLLRNLEVRSTSLIDALLQRPKSLSNETLIRKLLVSDHNLSDNQAFVVQKILGRICPSDPIGQPGLCLVCRGLGTEENHLLAVLVILLLEVLKNNLTTRILVSGPTSVAIDRILEGLLEQGFHDFLHVGSYRGVDIKIFPYVVCASSEEAKAEEDLKRLLQTVVGSERRAIQAELESLKAGKMEARREQLKQLRLVGATCYFSTSPLLKNEKFEVCVLNECSHIPEPISLLPIFHSECNRLLAVGNLAQPDYLTCGNKSSCEEGSAYLNNHKSSGKMRSLYDRLVALGHGTVVLSSYHPKMDDSNVAGDVFEDSQALTVRHSSSLERIKQVLDHHSFQVRDFWEGYKLYCFGYYSNMKSQRNRFSSSKMGSIVREMHGEQSFSWGASFDDKVRSTWSLIEDYLQRQYGQNCTDISTLIENYEDIEELNATEDGRLLLSIAKDDGNPASHRSAELAIQNCKKISENNIVQRIEHQLERVNTGLKNLQDKNT